ncbi:hypothetical protein BJ508DRAFT_361808 [Ascobolus immersus RN42]|uniref:protein-ribulosamine 3-kinase n=1 Tax=Ascobolus immersus RN42 TaxID=1160509 RepID=A0A3N4I833_ASCIM|nr:hypothetical protein BJ508DRAFT_361808 [Ascobolus immersus RN42]
MPIQPRPVDDSETFIECLERLTEWKRDELRATYSKPDGVTSTAWSDPYKISLLRKNSVPSNATEDAEKVFFIKFVPVRPSFPAFEVAKGEYASMKRISVYQPGLCPKPLGCGYVEMNTQRHLLPISSSWLGESALDTGKNAYFICEYLEIERQLGDHDGKDVIPGDDMERNNAIMQKFCESLVKLHQDNSTRTRPQATKRFGFSIRTFWGWYESPPAPQKKLVRSDSWCDIFKDSLKDLVWQLEGSPMSELRDQREEAVVDKFSVAWKGFEEKKVIETLLNGLKDPKGLGPIEPSLLHGDLWCGNTALLKAKDGETDIKTVIFNAACSYGHNEYELGNWLPERNKLRKFIDMYLEAYGGKCQPEEEFDLRLQLYSIKFNLQSAWKFPKENCYLETAIKDMEDLCQKVGGSGRRK